MNLDKRALIAELNHTRLERQLLTERDALGRAQARARHLREMDRRRRDGITEAQRVAEDANTILDALPPDPDAAKHRAALDNTLTLRAMRKDRT